MLSDSHLRTIAATELSQNFGDGRADWAAEVLDRRSDDLDFIVECHTENEFWQVVVAIEAAPACSAHPSISFEDHREHGTIGQAALRSDCAVAKVRSMGLIARRCFQCSARQSRGHSASTP
jgi:hypothetical protein